MLPDSSLIPLLIGVAIPVVGAIGFLFMSAWNYTRFLIKWNVWSGYHLRLTSILFGSAALLVSYLLVFILNALFDVINPMSDFLALRPFFISIVLTVPLGLSLPYFLNFFFDKFKHLRRTVEILGDSLWLVILDSIESKFLVELTLKNGKIFIGFPIKPLNFKYEYIDLIVYGTAYHIADLEPKLTKCFIETSVHKVSIKAEEILTARQFDSRVYKYFEETDLSSELLSSKT